MTFYHFFNCISLAYAPYYLIYKIANLSEYGAFWHCIQAGFIYTLTQLCKLLILATFFPLPNVEENQGLVYASSPMLEFLKTSIDLADLIGIYFAMSRIPGRGHSKILAISIGWGTAELIFTRFVAIWVGAKGVEFSWKYVQQSLDANICMVHHITTTALVWIWTRHDLNVIKKASSMKNTYIPIVAMLLLLCAYKLFLIDVLLMYIHLDPWTTLLIKGFVTAILGILTIRVYSLKVCQV